MLTYSTCTMLCAAGLLAIGYAGAGCVTMRKIVAMPLLLLAIAPAVLLGFIAMLYLVPLYERQRHAGWGSRSRGQTVRCRKPRQHRWQAHRRREGWSDGRRDTP